MIEQAFAGFLDVQVLLYSPQAAPVANEMPVRTTRPKMMPLRLRFEKGLYGPYAHNLNKVIEIFEGHNIRGFDEVRAQETRELKTQGRVSILLGLPITLLGRTIYG